MYDRDALRESVIGILVDEHRISASELARRTGTGRTAVTDILESMAKNKLISRDGSANTIGKGVVTVILKIYRQGAELMSFSGSGEILLRLPIRFVQSMTAEENIISLCADVSRYVNTLKGYGHVICCCMYDGAAAPAVRLTALFEEYLCREELIAKALNKMYPHKTVLYVHRDTDTMFLAREGIAVTDGRSIGENTAEALREVFRVAGPRAVVIEGTLGECEKDVRKACIDGNVVLMSVNSGHPLSIAEREAAKRVIASYVKRH